MKLDEESIVKKAVDIMGGWKKLGQEIGASRGTIYLWETGKSFPNHYYVFQCLKLIEDRKPRAIIDAVTRKMEKKSA